MARGEGGRSVGAGFAVDGAVSVDPVAARTPDRATLRRGQRRTVVRTPTARNTARAGSPEPRRRRTSYNQTPDRQGRTRVDLFEYQARDLFAKHGVPVLPGAVAETPEEARAASERLGGRVVVKAQVKTGGRGKAGGVKLADDPADAAEKAGQILGMDIKGHTVHRVMLAVTADIAEEYYVSCLLDRANRTFLAMASVEGGMDIEEVAATKPAALAKIAVDPLTGVDLAKAREIVDAANFPADIRDQVAEVLVTLWRVFTAEDATLVEVNP